MPKSVIGWAALIIVAIVIFHDPAGSAHAVRSWFDAARTFIENL